MKKILFAIALILLIIPLAGAVVASEGKGFVTSLYYDPSPAQPGQYLTLFIKVEPTGGDSIIDAVYRLEPEYPFSLKRGEEADRYFGKIGNQQQVLLEYDLFVDETALEGTYQIPLKLCLDKICTNWIEKEIDVTVHTGGVPGIEVGLESFDIFSGGKRGTVTFHVINRGDLDVKYLVMELLPTEQYEIISPSRIYIGEMESDDFETAEFEIYVNENVAQDAGQKIKLSTFIDYTDANDKKYSETLSNNLRVYSSNELSKMNLGPGTPSSQYLIMVLGAGVVLFFLYRHYKKKKRES